MLKRIVLPAMVLVLSCAAFAQEKEGGAGPEFSFDTTAVSKYLWRGFVAGDTPSLQPSATVAYKGFSVNAWGNFAHHPAHNQSFTELDLTMEYGHSFGRLSLVGGYTDYEFADIPSEEGNRSGEFYVGAGWAGRLNPSFKIYRDFKLGDGYYYSASITRPFRFARYLKGTTLLGIGLNQHQFQRQTTISNVESTTTFEVYTSDRVVLAPFVTVMVGNRSLFGTNAAFGMRATFRR